MRLVFGCNGHPYRYVYVPPQDTSLAFYYRYTIPIAAQYRLLLPFVATKLAFLSSINKKMHYLVENKLLEKSA